MTEEEYAAAMLKLARKEQGAVTDGKRQRPPEPRRAPQKFKRKTSYSVEQHNNALRKVQKIMIDGRERTIEELVERLGMPRDLLITECSRLCHSKVLYAKKLQVSTGLHGTIPSYQWRA